MANSVLCKAKAANKINAIALAGISLIIAILDVLVLIPIKTEHHSEREIDKVIHNKYYFNDYTVYEDYNVYGQLLRPYRKHDEKGVFPFLYDFFCNIRYGETLVSGILLLAFTVLFVVFLSLTIHAFKSRKCFLELNLDGIQGKMKKLFSSKSINQPFEQIDNLYIRKNIIDIIIGGRTIAISSGSSKIKFSCIANAQEFVDITLNELKKYKKSVASNPAADNVSNPNSMDDLLKLKILLDQGLITQEEFDEKRKAIVEKI